MNPGNRPTPEVQTLPVSFPGSKFGYVWPKAALAWWKRFWPSKNAIVRLTGGSIAMIAPKINNPARGPKAGPAGGKYLMTPTVFTMIQVRDPCQVSISTQSGRFPAVRIPSDPVRVVYPPPLDSQLPVPPLRHIQARGYRCPCDSFPCPIVSIADPLPRLR